MMIRKKDEEKKNCGGNGGGDEVGWETGLKLLCFTKNTFLNYIYYIDLG